jgi:restriction system protein
VPSVHCLIERLSRTQVIYGPVTKPLNQTEKRELIPQIQPAILLRFAYEIFRNDDAEIINLLVVNGWVRFDDRHTGIDTKAYTASLMVERSQIESLNLAKLDPFVAFQALSGKSAGKLVEIIPIEPSLSLNKKDSRFVDAKAVLNMLGTATNLAAMDWQDFEHLIRELFEKEFAGRGAEVKITQASRDRGVDAIAFDPDPIHGGKYVIQAKRYTNTVDVSAVRDLCAVVRKEGASRGILVTTSTYGADAYAFSNNEPVTLLNGAELLGLLKKHGYGFRINLQEARQFNLGNFHKEKSTRSN